MWRMSVDCRLNGECLLRGCWLCLPLVVVLLCYRTQRRIEMCYWRMVDGDWPCCDYEEERKTFGKMIGTCQEVYAVLDHHQR